MPQMHMLSVAMEPILHKSCPPNCQDMLGWLPHPVALYVLSFLDCGKTLLHFLVTVDKHYAHKDHDMLYFIVSVLPSSKFVPLQSSESNLEQLGKKSIAVEKLMWVRCYCLHTVNLKPCLCFASNIHVNPLLNADNWIGNCPELVKRKNKGVTPWMVEQCRCGC